MTGKLNMFPIMGNRRANAITIGKKSLKEENKMSARNIFKKEMKYKSPSRSRCFRFGRRGRG